MAKKHDENQDVQILGRKFKISTSQKTIHASKTQLIGNKTWGRIDYLCHYCGYVLVWDGGIVFNEKSYTNTTKKEELRNAKRESKEHKLSNKTKKNRL